MNSHGKLNANWLETSSSHDLNGLRESPLALQIRPPTGRAFPRIVLRFFTRTCRSGRAGFTEPLGVYFLEGFECCLRLADFQRLIGFHVVQLLRLAAGPLDLNQLGSSFPPQAKAH